MSKLRQRNLISISSLSIDEVELIISEAQAMKVSPRHTDILRGKTLAMIFEKPSTRTRVSFETGMYQLGGIGMYFSSHDLQVGSGETIHDTAKVLSRYVDAIMARTYSYQTILDLARFASVPVINGLTDYDHPCQVLSDLFTIYEKKGPLKELTLAYVGDGNNVLTSLIQGCAKTGMDINISTPPGYEPSAKVIQEMKETMAHTGARLEMFKEPAEAIRNADILYTDVWVSMGQEKDKEKRLKAFKNYQVNAALLSKAKESVMIMHCLPAHRGEEIMDEVLDGPNSIVFDQAENRLHTQKAILKLLLT